MKILKIQMKIWWNKMKLKISTIERIENEFAAIESVQTQDENAFNRFHFGYCLELKDQIEIPLYLSENSFQ